MDHRSGVAAALEARYERARAHVDKLTQSLLAKAFRGEVVPQDPGDEPAEVLLARIRAKADNNPKVRREGQKWMARASSLVKGQKTQVKEQKTHAMLQRPEPTEADEF